MKLIVFFNILQTRLQVDKCWEPSKLNVVPEIGAHWIAPPVPYLRVTVVSNFPAQTRLKNEVYVHNTLS
jgi:hypothetical protein